MSHAYSAGRQTLPAGKSGSRPPGAPLAKEAGSAGREPLPAGRAR
jgi:hypothetical protein